MSLFRRVPERRAVSESELVFRAMRDIRLEAGTLAFTRNDAMRVPAVFACEHGIAGPVSTLTLEGYRSVDGAPVPLARLPRLWREPSAELSLHDWVYSALLAMMSDGRAWGRIVATDPAGSPTQIELVPDEAVRVERDKATGRWAFTIDKTPVPAEQVWWCPGVVTPAHPFGVSMIDLASDAIALQIAARRYLLTFFRDGAHPSAVLQTDANPGQQGAQELKDRLRAATRGNREPLVLPAGVRLTPFQVGPADAAVNEVLRISATDIATFFLTPPELAGGSTGESLTYSTVEGQQILVLQRAIRFWMTKLERKLSATVAPAAIYAKFDENDLVRTDLKTKFDAIIAATAGPFLTPNEGREMDDRRPIPDGDALRGLTPAPQEVP